MDHESKKDKLAVKVRWMKNEEKLGGRKRKKIFFIDNLNFIINVFIVSFALELA